MAFSPFADQASADAEDAELVARVHAVDRDALQALLGRHQPWIYNLLARMLWFPDKARTRPRTCS